MLSGRDNNVRGDVTAPGRAASAARYSRPCALCGLPGVCISPGALFPRTLGPPVQLPAALGHGVEEGGGLAAEKRAAAGRGVSGDDAGVLRTIPE